MYTAQQHAPVLPQRPLPSLGEKETSEVAPRFQSFDNNKDGYLSKPQLRNFLMEYFCPVDSPTQFLLDIIDDAVKREGDNIDLKKAVNSIAYVKTKVATPIAPPVVNPFAASQTNPSPIFRSIPMQPANPFANTSSASLSDSSKLQPFTTSQGVYSNPQMSYPSYTPPPSSIQTPSHGYPAAQYPSMQRPPTIQPPSTSQPPSVSLTKAPFNPFSPSFKAPMNSASPQSPSPFSSVINKSSTTNKPYTQQTLPNKGTSAATHYVSEEEKRAFVEFMNSNDKLRSDPDLSNVMPIDSSSDALFRVVSDGALFCKYLNIIQPGIIPASSIKVRPKNTFEKSENHSLAIEAAKKLGCSVVNIGPEDLIQGKPHLVMGLIWQLIKRDVLSKVSLREHPEIYQLTVDGSTSLKEITESTPEDVLLRWMNFHLKNAGYPKTVSNFAQDMRDCSAYTILMHQIEPSLCSLEALSVTDPVQRAQLVMQNAEKLGCHKFLSTQDVVNGNSRLNLAFVADLFNKHSALTMPSLEEFTRAKKQNATLSYILDDAEARLRQILSDQQFAYELQQQEILLYREQKLREQRELAEQEAMLIAQQEQEQQMLEQQQRLKDLALQQQEAMAFEEQRKEQSKFEEQKRNKELQVQRQEDSLRREQQSGPYSSDYNYTGQSSSSSSLSNESYSSYSGPARQAGGGYSTMSYSSSATPSSYSRSSYSAYSASVDPVPARVVQTSTVVSSSSSSASNATSRPSYTVAQPGPTVSTSTTLLTNQRLGVFQKVGKKLDRTIDKIKR